MLSYVSAYVQEVRQMNFHGLKRTMVPCSISNDELGPETHDELLYELEPDDGSQKIIVFNVRKTKDRFL